MRRALFAAALLLAPWAFAQQEVVPGVRLIRGTFTPGSQPDGNSVVIDAPSGLVVVDSGRHASHTRKILDLAKSSGRPIVAVVNTHWHLDHIGGNAAIRAAYPEVRVYASNALDDALTGFLASYRKQLAEQPPSAAYEAEMKLIDSGKALAPDVVIAKPQSLPLAGRAFRVGLERSVTQGDVWLFDEATGVLIAGDLVTLPAPFLDTACPARWSATLDELSALDFDVLIPGHGSPLTKRQFEIYRSAFHALLHCEAKEVCISGWTKTIAPLTNDEAKLTAGLMGYYVDLLRSDRLTANCP